MQPSSNELNLTQVKNILDTLATYCYMQDTEVCSSPSGVILTPSSSAAKTIADLNQFVQDPSEQWSTNLNSLNHLIGRIRVFLINNPQADQIEEATLQNAVAGLSCILNKKVREENIAPAFIEKAIIDLAVTCEELHRIREEKAKALFDKGEKSTFVPTQVIWNTFNPFQYFSMVSRIYTYSSDSSEPKSYSTSTLEKSSSELILTKEQTTALPNAIRPFDYKKMSELKQVYQTVETPPDVCKLEVRQYFKDPRLTDLEEVEYEHQKFLFPQQANKDLTRSELKYNGVILYSMRVNDAFDPELPGEKRAALACLTLIDALELACVQNLGVILQQGATGKLMMDLFHKKPEAWDQPSSPFRGLYPVNVSPLVYEINLVPPNDDLHIKLKFMVGLQDSVEIFNNIGIIRGFMAFERYLIIPKAELNDPNLQNKPLDQILPSMKAKQTLSAIYPTPQEAEESITKQPWSLWNLFYSSAPKEPI